MTDENTNKWTTIRSYSLRTGKEQWRAMGPWRETEEEALFDLPQQIEAELSAAVEHIHDLESRIAELETAPLIVAEARLDATREELGRELLDSVDGYEQAAVAALKLRITELERLLTAAREILVVVY